MDYIEFIWGILVMLIIFIVLINFLDESFKFIGEKLVKMIIFFISSLKNKKT